MKNFTEDESHDPSPSPGRRVIALSGLDPSAEYVLRAINAQYPLHQVIKICWADRPRRRVGSPVQAVDRAIRALERRLYYDRYYARQSKSLDSMLSERHKFPALPLPIEVEKNKLNTRKTAELIKSFEADVLLVCGAPILKPLIFNAPRLATVNVHYGIAPDYRGEGTLFWPLCFGDYHKIGLSILVIDAGVDTGQVLTQIFLPVTAGDNETKLLARASQALAGPITEILAEASFDSRPQICSTVSGRNFRWADRRVWHDLCATAKSFRLPRSARNEQARVVHHWRNCRRQEP